MFLIEDTNPWPFPEPLFSGQFDAAAWEQAGNAVADCAGPWADTEFFIDTYEAYFMGNDLDNRSAA